MKTEAPQYVKERAGTPKTRDEALADAVLLADQLSDTVDGKNARTVMDALVRTLASVASGIGYPLDDLLMEIVDVYGAPHADAHDCLGAVRAYVENEVHEAQRVAATAYHVEDVCLAIHGIVEEARV